MAAPGDPDRPTFMTPEARPDPDIGAAPGDHSHDDLIGFTSPSSLAGRPRAAEAEIAPEPVAEPDLAVEDDAASMQMDDDLFADRPTTAPVEPPSVEPLLIEPGPEQPPLPMSGSQEPIFIPRPAPEPEPAPEPTPKPAPQPSYASVAAPQVVAPTANVEAMPSWAMETPSAARASKPTFGRADTPAAAPEGAMGLYTIYALILFAVPTLGVAALVALVAVIGRPAPQQALALSHYLYQKRTLWIAAIAAVLGVVLIAVNLGVFVLFLLAVWTVIRGATGILRLSAGRPIARPNGWFF